METQTTAQANIKKTKERRTLLKAEKGKRERKRLAIYRGSESLNSQVISQRYFKGIPVRDAIDFSLRVFVSEIDIKTALKHDPTCCPLAQAMKRLYNATAAVFLKNWCYVDLLDETGTRYVYRFRMTTPLRKAVATFDRTHVMPIAGFTLAPVPKSARLEVRAARTKAYYNSEKGKANRQRKQAEKQAAMHDPKNDVQSDLNGEQKKSVIRRTYKRIRGAIIKGENKKVHGDLLNIAIVEDVRNGSGMVSFKKVAASPA